MNRLKLYTPLERTPLASLIHHEHHVMLLGSCFADRIGAYFYKYLFSCISNPFGTLYDSHSLAKNLIRSCQFPIDEQEMEERIFCADEVFYSYDTHSALSALSKDELLEHLRTAYKTTRQFIQKADWLVLSLGTSCLHTFEGKFPVANCHKQPSKRFKKHFQTVDEIAQDLTRLIEAVRLLNPKIQGVLTVSPVRHLALGMVENTRSKARLHLAVEEVCFAQEGMYYFPAFELMNDEWRDYRFYAQDRIHPSEEATAMIWDRFMECCFDRQTRAYVEEVSSIVQASEHRLRFPETQTAKKFKHSFYQKVVGLQKQYPQKHWEMWLSHFRR